MGGISNEELLRKAAILLDTLATSGKLNPKQADRFIDYVVDETILKNNARIERFRNEALDIDKIGVGARVMVPFTEATDPGVRIGVTTSKVTLTPKAVMVPFEIGDLFKERSIEENVADHVVKMMAKAFANNWEELYINGDTNGHAILESNYPGGADATRYRKDSLMALFDGWFRLADGGNSFDAQGANIGISVFGGMVRKMPTKFRRNKRDLRFFISPDLASLYYEKLASRSTALGDATAGGAPHAPLGIPLVEVPLLDLLPPVVEHVVLTGTAATALRYGPISSVVVTTSTLGATPEDAYTEDTDYVVDYTAGTIARAGGSTIGSGATVKVTYKANPQIVLTHYMNYISAINTSISIERDRRIFARLDQYAIHASVACEFEEDTALVKGINIGSSI